MAPLHSLGEISPMYIGTTPVASPVHLDKNNISNR